MTFYPNIYYYQSHVENVNDLAFLPGEFSKALANAYFQDYRHLTIANHSFYLCHNVTDINNLSVYHGQNHLEFQAEFYRPLTAKELQNCFKQSQVWYRQQTKLEAACVAYLKQHPEADPHRLPYYYDGQLNNLKQSNRLGESLSIISHYYSGFLRPYTSYQHCHRTKGNWGSGRVGHAQHAFALDNHQAISDRQQVIDQYPGTKIRHLNRHHSKNHPINFPVFDDDEYVQGWHSTSWKHSSKAPHSYLQHTKQKHYRHRDFNQKRLFAQQLND